RAARRRQRAWFGADRPRTSWARIDRGLPAGELGIGRPLDREFQATLDDRSERDVGDRKEIACEPTASGDVAIEYFELRNEVGRLRAEIRGPLRGRLLR